MKVFIICSFSPSIPSQFIFSLSFLGGNNLQFLPSGTKSCIDFLDVWLGPTGIIK